ISVRRALGARRRDVFRQLGVESALIGLAGGVLGIGLAELGLWAVRQRPNDYAHLARMNGVMLIATVVLAIVVSLLAGLLPAWRACRIATAMQLKAIFASLKHHKLTALLLVLQVAFSCAIITNAVFLIVQRVQRVTTPSGLDERALSLVEVDDLDAGANPLALHKTDLAALRKLPGVESAALISNVPFSNSEHGSGGCTSLAAVHAVMKAQ